MIPLPNPEAETDALIARVNGQQAEQCFDANDTATLEALVESFSDPRGVVRLRIAETLGEIGQPAAPVLMAALAEHANPVVRRACAKTLTLIKDPRSVPTLVQALLKDEDTVVHGSAAGALAQIGGAAVPPLLAVLASPDYPETTKGHAAWALAFIGAEAKDAFYEVADSPVPEVRSAVIGAIAKIAQEDPEERAFELLIQALNDDIEDVRSEAAAVLGNLAYRPAVEPLLGLLQHDSSETRKAAALALMKIGDPAALIPLKTALAQATGTALQPILDLAIGQLENT